MSDVLVLKNPTAINPTKTKITKWFSDFTTPIQYLLKTESIDVVPFNSKWQQFLIRKQLNDIKISSYEYLPINWNGNGATAISKDVIENALKLLNMIDHQPEIFPTARNTIQFEYEKDDNYLEIEIFSDFLMIYKNIGSKEEEIKTNDFSLIYKEIIAYHAAVSRK
jgi:hypothetical protein